ncbi:hypothetical protein MUK42_08127 [Musa troglodytarum]|uniref:LRAT domain-containing protein n=1 Tax=Musa troglodytarum TaxID=320322 RepID=A0A9E7EDM8_9LILI|nr:hypothetical protein MUK42_08127 [Musa troglodytarum]
MVSRSETKAGDHIDSWRAAYTYSHHGIEALFCKVAHFTRKKDASSGSSSAASAICPTFPDCGFRQPDSGVTLCRLDCFLGNGALHRFEYGVPPPQSSSPNSAAARAPPPSPTLPTR